MSYDEEPLFFSVELLLFTVGWEETFHLERRPLFGQLYQPQIIHDECGAVGGIRTVSNTNLTSPDPVDYPP
jgi:hypothetical protein